MVSSIDTYNYNLAQYLGFLLTLHIPSEYSAKDSFTFIEEIKSVSVTDKFLVSFDVTSVFTNIPLSEAIDIAINLIFQSSPDIKFAKRELCKLLRIAPLKHILLLMVASLIRLMVWQWVPHWRLF